MPTPTYTALATVTLGASASSVTFSSIPATYRDLILVFAGTVSTAQGLKVQFNADATDGNYSRVYMYGDGSSAVSESFSNSRALEVGTSQTTATLQVMDYSATDKHKTQLSRGGPADSLVLAQASRWANTAAITSLGIVADGGTTISTGTVISLYGVIA